MKTSIAILCLMILAGCASRAGIVNTVTLPNGKNLTVIEARSLGASGTSLTALYLFDEQGALIRGDSGSSQGPTEAALSGLVPAAMSIGAFSAGAIVAGDTASNTAKTVIDGMGR